jgi:HAD superfamily hydrolase (TIGR01509 family)
MRRPQLILFDLGGVFVKLGGMPQFMQWTGLSADAIKSRWLASTVVQQFETGRIPYDAFADGLLSEWPIPMTKAEFYAELRSWASQLLPGALDTLRAIRTQYTTGCFTNTNPVQWPFVRDTLGLGRMFLHQFVSYEIGYVKPLPDAFRHVAESLDVSPSSVLFLDDSADNVEAGRQFGFDSHLVEGPTGVRAKFDELGMEIEWDAEQEPCTATR